MKIGIVAPPWLPVPPPRYGGIEVVIDTLARGYSRQGHDVLLFATGDSECPVPKMWALEQHKGFYGLAVATELYHVMAAYDAMKECDVVHDHTVYGGVHAQRFANLPVFVTIHYALNPESTALFARLDHRVALVAVSQAQAAQASQCNVIRVIPHGIDLEKFCLGPGDGGYLLFLGRMVQNKGVHRAIEVARRTGLELRIAAKMSDPWELEYFRARVEPHLGQRIIYEGEVDTTRRLELLTGARALLFPIRWREPFGLVMIEALACGTPVIAFSEGSVPEIVNHGRTGFVCDNTDEMVDFVGQLDEIDRRACRREAEERFSADRMVRDYLEAFATWRPT